MDDGRNTPRLRNLSMRPARDGCTALVGSVAVLIVISVLAPPGVSAAPHTVCEGATCPEGQQPQYDSVQAAKLLEQYERATNTYHDGVTQFARLIDELHAIVGAHRVAQAPQIDPSAPAPRAPQTDPMPAQVPATSGAPPQWYYTSLVVAVSALLSVLITQIMTAVLQRRQFRRTAMLERVNRQLSDLYAPLFALSKAGEDLWDTQGKALEERLRQASDRRLPYPEIERLLAEWIALMTTIYKPMNEERLERIRKYYHLLTANDLMRQEEQVYTTLAQHTYEFNLVMQQWQPANLQSLWRERGFHAFQPKTPFPERVLSAAYEGFNECLRRQRRLLLLDWRTRLALTWKESRLRRRWQRRVIRARRDVVTQGSPRA